MTMRSKVLTLIHQIHAASDCDSVRIARVNELRRLGPRAIDVLATELLSADADIACLAAMGLSHLGQEAIPVADALIRGLEHSDMRVALLAENALKTMGAAAFPSVITAIASATSTNVKLAAIQILARPRVAPRATTDVDALAFCLADSDPNVREHAATYLGLAGARAPNAIRALLEAFSKESPGYLREVIRWALREVCVANINAVADAITSENANGRLAAMRVLADAISPVQDAIAHIRELAVQDNSSEFREATRRSITSLAVIAFSLIEDILSLNASMAKDENGYEDRARNELLTEIIRSCADSLLVKYASSVRKRIMSRNMRYRRKRAPGELQKSLVALLDTCLEWTDAVSERNLHESLQLNAKRRESGLKNSVSLITVRNHLKILAKLCGLKSILVVGEKRQTSHFRDGAKDALSRVRPILIQSIQDEELQSKQS